MNRAVLYLSGFLVIALLLIWSLEARRPPCTCGVYEAKFVFSSSYELVLCKTTPPGWCQPTPSMPLWAKILELF